MSTIEVGDVVYSKLDPHKTNLKVEYINHKDNLTRCANANGGICVPDLRHLVLVRKKNKTYPANQYNTIALILR